ncbi:MAG TPA: RHS repeat-associated core domain-containing protein, partial [Chthoniobacterales bacterium]
YDSYGNRLSVTDELGHTTTTSYDEFRRMKSVTDPLNRTALYDYTLPGQSCGCDHADNHPTSITLPSAKKTFMTYDTEWRLTSRTVAYGTVDTATTGYFYDAAGNVTEISDPKGNTWSQMHDSRNRRISATDPLSNTTQWTHDAAGNVLTVARADGGVTTNTYDEMDRLLTGTNPKNETTSYAYDDADNLVTLTDARNNAYSFEYDLLKRRTRFIYPDSSHEDNDYDGVGNLTLYTARNGVTCTRIFDNRNREISLNWSDSTPDATKTYDAAGRLLTAGNGVSTSTYAYDNANQLTSETQTPAGLGTSFTVGYTYDIDGNRATLTYPDGMVVAHTYTHRNEVASISADGPPPLATYAYDTDGNRTSKSLENGTSAAYTYDDANRLLGISHSLTVNAQPSTLGLAYGYNTVNNRLTRSETVGPTPMVTQIYGYDPIDQITSVNYGPGRSETFAYDATGNRTSATDSVSGTTIYTANALNQYTAVDSLPVPAYDANGNLTAFDGWTYTYDTENRLTGASKTGTSASFTYDWRRRQASRTINGTTTWFIYDGWNLLAEYSSAGTLQAKYIHGPVVDEILTRMDGSGAVYYHNDALGSTVALTDSAGAVVERYTYDVFGTPTIRDPSDSILTQSPHGNRFLFTGREWIAEAALYDYRNRVYFDQLGRFLQTDPIRFRSRDTNLYRYVANNPITYMDPFGLFHYYGNWGGPGWTNGSNLWPETDNFPRSPRDIGFRPPIDARDQCYYEHDTCLRDCAYIQCPAERQTCRRGCDQALSSCLRSLGGRLGDTGFEEDLFDDGIFGGGTPNDNPGNWEPF